MTTSRRSTAGVSYRPLFERCLYALALAGILLTVHLAFWYSGPTTAVDPVCGAGFDCEAVLNEDPAPLGMSSTYWGLLFYVAIAAIGIGIMTKGGRLGRWLSTLRRLAIGAGFLYSIFLTTLQFAILADRCLLCLISAGIVTLMVAALLLERYMGNVAAPPPARALRLYGGLAAVALVLVLADYKSSGAGREESGGASLAPEEEVDTALCSYDPAMPYFENIEQLVTDYDPIAGRRDAPVTIIEFLDPNCTHCRDLHPVMQSVLEAFPEQARIVYKPIALVGGPSFSLDEVMALWLAEEAGRFQEMLELQFQPRDGASDLSVERLTAFADDIGMNAGRFRDDLRTGRLMGRARRAMQIHRGLGLTSVPAVIIDGRLVHHASRSLGCLRYFVRQALEEAGAPE